MLTLISIDHLILAQSQSLLAYYQEAITATISHEQLNPLHSIINFAEFLD